MSPTTESMSIRSRLALLLALVRRITLPGAVKAAHGTSSPMQESAGCAGSTRSPRIWQDRKALASKVQSLGMKVLVYDPYIEPALIGPAWSASR